MIEFSIKKDNLPLVTGEIEQVYLDESGTRDYMVRVKVDRGLGSLGMHQKRISGFDPKKHNALGLVRLALESLDESVFEREPGAPDTPTHTDWLKRITGGK